MRKSVIVSPGSGERLGCPTTIISLHIFIFFLSLSTREYTLGNSPTSSRLLHKPPGTSLRTDPRALHPSSQ